MHLGHAVAPIPDAGIRMHLGHAGPDASESGQPYRDFGERDIAMKGLEEGILRNIGIPSRDLLIIAHLLPGVWHINSAEFVFRVCSLRLLNSPFLPPIQWRFDWGTTSSCRYLCPYLPAYNLSSFPLKRQLTNMPTHQVFSDCCPGAVQIRQRS
ncbi:hypothetical protein FIBSPDRAFT_525787 [Athelia psychrophila]|uniref:Uncharacterized protein n=1 Tax=Athelia psychrophila TaxID=1759441 RepID=A0A166JJB4_9AGAM|nr:hypothetical protein FIBSPDRAFT_525787 [Fibularhizoctonia sp. CBS 109695]